jgi:uncharacterized membrane protein YeaQ/YmgE (transglycosylase-associated protein family)
MSTLELILVWIVFGAVAGLIARVVFWPGPPTMGWAATIGLIVGSLVGALTVDLALGGRSFAAQTAGWVGSIAGTFLVLAGVWFVRQRRFVR